MAKKWVRAKKDLQVGEIIVPKGTIGYIKEDAYMPEENGATQFPQTVFKFKKSELTPIKIEEYDMEELLATINSFERHYCREGEFQFNIKLYGYEIPDSVRNAFDDSQIYGELQNILSDQLSSFVDKRYDDASLQADFPWIKSWRQEGRSGGWLILRHADKMSSLRMQEILDELEFDALEGEHNEEELEALQEAKEQIFDLAMDLSLIHEKVKKGVASVDKFIGTEEAWYNLLSTIEQQEESEVVYECPSCRFVHKLDTKGEFASIDLAYTMIDNIKGRIQEQSDSEYLAFKGAFATQLEDIQELVGKLVKEDIK